MTSGVDGTWVLCRVETGLVIVIMQSDYNQWVTIQNSTYEFIAKGKRELMRQYRDLMKET
jgi:hypothetical protein